MPQAAIPLAHSLPPVEMSSRYSPTIDWASLCPDWAQRDREKILPQAFAVWNPAELESPRAVFARDPELARQLTASTARRLREACQRMSRKGWQGRWTYDVPLHLAALLVLRREERIRDAIAAACAAREPAPESDPHPDLTAEPAPMTFTAFQETREHVADLAARFPHLDFGGDPVPGHVYLGELWISEGHGPGGNLFGLQVGNSNPQFSADLETLERMLWAYALAEGFASREAV